MAVATLPALTQFPKPQMQPSLTARQQLPASLAMRKHLLQKQHKQLTVQVLTQALMNTLMTTARTAV